MAEMLPFEMPPFAYTVRCRACNRAIRWVKTAAGKNAPMCICPRCFGRGEKLANGGEIERPCVLCKGTCEINHFIDCPAKEQFKRAHWAKGAG